MSDLKTTAHDHYEPDDATIAEIIKCIEEERFDELPNESKEWVCHKLMPSLMRFGCYPPPDQQ